MNPVHQELYKGLTIKIFRDEDPQPPDSWGDDNLLLVNYHRDFAVKRDKVITENDVCAMYQGESTDATKALLEKYHLFPLTMLSHSGVWLKLGPGGFACDAQGWDTCRVGVVLVAKNDWPNRPEAEVAADSLVTDWNQYLSGQVYGFEVTGANKEHLSSCWGFYGYDDKEADWYVLQEARSIVDYHTNEIAKKHQKKLKAQIQHHVPLQRR